MPSVGAQGNSPLVCQRLLLGMSGSVAVAEMPRIVRLLRQTFAREVTVVMTASAQRFVSAEAIECFSGSPVYTDPFGIPGTSRVPHIELPRWADLFCVAPTTANLLGKVAHGICDDLLTTCIVAATSPVVFVPCMNQAMWDSRIVQRNADVVRGLGHRIVPPVEGIEIFNLAANDGAMPPFDQLLVALQKALSDGESDNLSS